MRAPGEVGNLGQFVQESVCGEDEESNTSSHEHERDSDEYYSEGQRSHTAAGFYRNA